MNKYKLGSRLIMGSIFTILFGVLLALQVSLHGLFWGSVWTLGTILVAVGLNKLIETAARWSVEGEMQEARQELGEFDSELEKLKDSLLTKHSGAIELAIKNGMPSVRFVDEEEAKKLQKRKDIKKIVIGKKPTSTKKSKQAKHVK